MNALSFYYAHGISASGAPLDRKWRKGFAAEYFGTDIPDWFDRYDSVYGPVPLAAGFQTELRSYLNRYEFAPFDLESTMERAIRCETSVAGAGNIYWHCHRRLVLKEWIAQMYELLPSVQRGKEEFLSFLYTFRAAELLLGLSLGHIMNYWKSQGELYVGYQLTPSLQEDDLARAGAEMDALAEEMTAFYSDYSPAAHVKNFAGMLFKKEFRI